MFRTTRRALGVFTFTLGCALTTLIPITTPAIAQPLPVTADFDSASPASTETALASTLSVKEYLPATSSVTSVHYLDQNRLQVISNRDWVTSEKEEDKQGLISLLNLDTKESIPAETRLPAETLTAITYDRNYTLIYDYGRNRKSGGITIYDGTSAKTVGDLAKFPDRYSWTGTPDGTFYAVKGYDFYQVSPASGAVTKVATLSATPELPKFGALIAPEYDPRSGKIWALLKYFKAPELVQIDPKNWQVTKRIDLLDTKVNSLPGKFTLRTLFSDFSKNRLYLGISPASTESDKRDLVLSYDLASESFLPTPLVFAPTMSQYRVHPVSHEIFAASSAEKAFYIANPFTAKTQKALDLSENLTNPKFSSPSDRGAENLQGFTFSPDGSELVAISAYPTKEHPGSDKSTLTRIAITALTDVYGQANPDKSAALPAESEENPAAASRLAVPVPAAPLSKADTNNPQVKAIKDAAFQTSFTEYMREFWGPALAEGNVTPDKPRNPNSWQFTKGTGWVNQKTNEAKVVWDGALEFRPYEILVPDMFVTFANPVYTRDASGNEKISFDMYWNLNQANNHAEGFKRVNFLVSQAPATAPIPLGPDSKFTFTPAYAQVHYRLQPETCTPGGNPCQGAYPTDFIDSFNDEMKAWWYATSGSRNDTKVPGSFHLSFSLAAQNDAAADPGQSSTPGQPALPGQPDNPKQPKQPEISKPSEQPKQAGNSFKDIATYPFGKEIQWLAASGVTTGYPDRTFRPHDSVSRAAMAAFLYRLEGKPDYTAPKQSPFTDIKPGDDFYKEICWLASKGITTGYADGSFKPWDSISREAMAAFLHRYDSKVAAKKLPVKLAAKKFTDTGATPFAKDIAWLSSTGVTTGYADGSFKPYDPIERGAIAAFFYRMKH